MTTTERKTTTTRTRKASGTTTRTRTRKPATPAPVEPTPVAVEEAIAEATAIAEAAAPVVEPAPDAVRCTRSDEGVRCPNERHRKSTKGYCTAHRAAARQAWKAMISAQADERDATRAKFAVAYDAALDMARKAAAAVDDDDELPGYVEIVVPGSGSKFAFWVRDAHGWGYGAIRSGVATRVGDDVGGLLSKRAFGKAFAATLSKELTAAGFPTEALAFTRIDDDADERSIQR